MRAVSRARRTGLSAPPHPLRGTSQARLTLRDRRRGSIVGVTNSRANPRRTTLAPLRADTRCELAAPGCQGAATRVVPSADGRRHACAACAGR